MTLNQSALLELSEALRAADGGDLMRVVHQPNRGEEVASNDGGGVWYTSR